MLSSRGIRTGQELARLDWRPTIGYPDIMSPRRALSQLLLAVFVIGGLSCPCPASAMTGHEAPSQHEAHRHGHAETPAADADDSREHTQCQDGCNHLSAEASWKKPYSYLAKPPLDPDIEVLEPVNATWPGMARALTWTGPPPQTSRLPHETPVRRFDRLLD